MLIRTVAGPEVGFGHLRRCLTLATALEGLGVRSRFLVAAPPPLLDRVTAAGFEATGVSGDGGLVEILEHAEKAPADVIVTDDYALDTAYHAALMRARRAVAIDDLADRALPVDLVVNGSAGAERLTYRGGATTRYLLGPRYSLVRRVFAEWTGRVTLERVRRVLITTGGSDRAGLAPRFARWALETLGDVDVDVVVGPLFDATHREWPAPVTLHHDPDDMRSLMRAADLALCAGGQTLYELAATGTPAIAVQVAANQARNLAALAAAGTIVVAGEVSDRDLEAKVTTTLTALASDQQRRATMSARGRGSVDGHGATRVAEAIGALIDRG